MSKNQMPKYRSSYGLFISRFYLFAEVALVPKVCGSSHYLSLELWSLNKLLYQSNEHYPYEAFVVAGMHHEVLKCFFPKNLRIKFGSIPP